MVTCMLNGEDVDNDDSLDFLSRMKCHTVLKNNDISKVKAWLMQIAHMELVQEPVYVTDATRAITLQLRPYFPNMQSVYEMYDQKLPTTKKVVNLLNYDPSTQKETQIFDFLKQFIRGLGKADLN